MPTQTTIPTKLAIITDRENKIFHDKTRFKQYLATKFSPVQSTKRKTSTQGNQLYPQKTQTIDISQQQTQKKEKKHTHNNITYNKN